MAPSQHHDNNQRTSNMWLQKVALFYLYYYSELEKHDVEKDKDLNIQDPSIMIMFFSAYNRLL